MLATTGKKSTRVRGGQVIELSLSVIGVKDISPVRALTSLETLNCRGERSSQQKRAVLADLSPLQGLRLKVLNCSTTDVSDLSPLAGMPLAHLDCPNCPVADLSPLRGMALTWLACYNTKVNDLSPLTGAPLQVLIIQRTAVHDLSVLKGMPLLRLDCDHTQVNDLSPIRDSHLKTLGFDFDPQRDSDILRSIKTLEKINGLPVAEFWKQVEAGKIPQPSTGANKPTATDAAFIKEVAALPAEQQVARVVAKLKELNPGFDGKEEHKVVKGQVEWLSFPNTTIWDVAPVRALVKLKYLRCGGLSLPTEHFRSPLSDLTPLQGLSLGQLDCACCNIADLTPLRGMPLTRLNCYSTLVTDITPLRGMPLGHIDINNSLVSDLSPLSEAPLATLFCHSTRVTELLPIKDVPLKEIRYDFDPKRDTETLRSIKTLEKINGLPVAEFWKQVEAGKIPPPK